MSEETFHVSTAAIIGAGPSGGAIAKFEQRTTVGGIWNTDSTSSINASAFPSPIYDGIESNIPSAIMKHSDLAFPADTPLLPDATHVLDYLKEYANEVLHLIQFRHQVLDVVHVDAGVCEGQRKWQLEVLDLGTDCERREVFDAVLVASGRYNEPYIPDIIGLGDWMRNRPGSVIHSKSFRSVDIFKDQKVIILGYSSSGVDLATKIERVSKPLLLISQKSANGLSLGCSTPAKNKVILSSIKDLHWQTRHATFVDGTEASEIDHIVLCTGYEYTYPFLSHIAGFEGGAGHGNTQTYQHIFHTPSPTLAFALLPLRVVAFPFVESQAAVVARVWSRRLTLPSRSARGAWVSENMWRRGEGKHFHKLSYPSDADYMNEMYRWCCEAEGEDEKRGKGQWKGKMPPFWGKRERWLRREIHVFREATEARGGERFDVRRIEDVGFCFEADGDH